jgi:hypothetical protein
MATLTCDICDGKLVIGAGGVASCVDCGMEHSKERLKEKLAMPTATVEASLSTPSVTSRQDAQAVQNLLTLAENALNSENHAEAESFANRVLAIEPGNWQAWAIKGHAAGWQSRINNVRIQETANCFANSLKTIPANQYDEKTAEFTTAVDEIANAIMSLNADFFVESPNDADDFIWLVKSVNTSVKYFETVCALPIPEYKIGVAQTLYSAALKAWDETVLPEYRGSDGYPNAFMFTRLISQASECSELIQFSISLDEMQEENIERYDLLMRINDFCSEACSWSLQSGSLGLYHAKENTLSSDAKATRFKLNQHYNQRQLAIEDYLAGKEIEQFYNVAEQTDAFWQVHTKQKKLLEKEELRLEQELMTAESAKLMQVHEAIKERLEELDDILSDDYEETMPFPEYATEYINSISEWHESLSAIRSSNVAVNLTHEAKMLELANQITEQNEMIATNKGFFGEPARIRKVAERTKAQLTIALEQLTENYPT